METTTTQDPGTTHATNINRALMVTPDAEAAGAIVWWELTGTVDSAKLYAAWDTASLPMSLLPENPTPKIALKRAVREMAEKRRLVRPLAGEMGYSLVSEEADGQTLSYQQQVTASVNMLGTLSVTPPDSPLADSVRANYQLALSQLTTGDISDLLVHLCADLLAVGLRQRGGFYFLPPAAVAAFRRAVGVLRGVSGHVCYEIPAMRTKEAVAAILAAITREATSEAASFEEVLSTGECGEKALRTKTAQCALVAKKVAAYEQLLGESLVSIQARLEGLRARLAEAALLASMQSEA